MIEAAFIIALVVLFIHVTTWEGMINNWVHGIFWYAPTWIKKPLFDCPICMSIWWGAVIIIAGEFFGHWQCHGFFNEVIILFAAGGINTVLIYAISSDKEEIKVLEDDADTKSTN